MEKQQPEESPGSAQQYLVFHLGQTLFGVEILQMLSIVRMAPITRVPRTPHFLEGVVNVRGRVVPVVDLRKRLVLPATEYNDKARILIAEVAAQPVGMLVDAVDGIWRLPGDSIQPAPETVAQVSGVFLSGVVHYRDRLIAVLDLACVLGVREDDQVAASQARGSRG